MQSSASLPDVNHHRLSSALYQQLHNWFSCFCPYFLMVFSHYLDFFKTKVTCHFTRILTVASLFYSECNSKSVLMAWKALHNLSHSTPFTPPSSLLYSPEGLLDISASVFACVISSACRALLHVSGGSLPFFSQIFFQM